MMCIPARFRVDDSQVISPDEIHRLGQLRVIERAENQARRLDLLRISGLHTLVSGSPNRRAARYVPGGLRCIDDVITGTGAQGDPVVEVLKRVPVVLCKNRAPEILPGCEQIKECIQPVIVHRFHVTHCGVITQVIDDEAILRCLAFDICFGREVGLLGVALQETQPESDLERPVVPFG